MLRTALALPLVVLSASIAPAQTQTTYEGSSYGTGSGKCSSYRMAVTVTRAGDQVDGIFQQEGRTQREFHAKADAGGRFKTETQVGGGGTMNVSGMVAPDNAAVLLDGYCRFDTKLSRKQ